MRTRVALFLGLLLGHSSVQAQGRLVKPTFAPSVAATVTVPAMSSGGNLSGVGINLRYVRVNVDAGQSLQLMGPTSGTLASSAMVYSTGSRLPNGSYSVRFDFHDVTAATQLAVTWLSGGTIATCTLNASSGPNNIQSCAASFAITDGWLNFLGVQPTTYGVSMWLTQVTVTRYQ